MNYISLFTGIGGFDLAFNRAGHNCVAMVERDKAAQAVLRARFPGVPLFDDVVTFGRKDIDGSVDIVVGGSPCQSFSVAGLRKSLGDDRGNLAFEFCRIVDEFSPRWVVWENVPGVLSTKDNAFGNFLAALVGEDSAIVPTRGKWTNAGLVAGPERTAAWRVLDAQYFGVAQRRRRVFVVAGAGAERVAPVLFESEGVRRDSPPRRETRQGVAGGAAPRASADVSAALSASGRGTSRTGESRGQDVLIVNPIVVKTDNTQINDWGVLEDGTTHTLGGATDAVVYDARGNGSIAPNITGDHNAKIGDYTAVVVQQNTRDEVRLVNGDGQIAGALAAQAGMKQQNYVVQAPATSPALKSEGADASEDGTGRHTLIVQEPVMARSTGAGWYTADELASLRAQTGGTTFDIVVQHNAVGVDGQLNADHELMGALRAHESGGIDGQFVMQQNAVGDPDLANTVETKVRHDYDNQVGTAIVAFEPDTFATVRRLTPTEAERLQAFPDGWTAEGAKPDGTVYAQADTPRYKQLGNAVCVNVVEWIARRIP